MQTTSKTPEQLFDDRVQELIESGKSYIEISRELNVDPSIIRWSDIISNREDTNRKIPKTNTKTIDWDTLDKEMLQLVQQAIKDLQGNGETRPCRVKQEQAEVRALLYGDGYDYKDAKRCTYSNYILDNSENVAVLDEILNSKGINLVVADTGSGKSHSMLERAKVLVQNNKDTKVVMALPTRTLTLQVGNKPGVSKMVGGDGFDKNSPITASTYEKGADKIRTELRTSYDNVFKLVESDY